MDNKVIKTNECDAGIADKTPIYLDIANVKVDVLKGLLRASEMCVYDKFIDIFRDKNISDYNWSYFRRIIRLLVAVELIPEDRYDRIMKDAIKYLHHFVQPYVHPKVIGKVFSFMKFGTDDVYNEDQFRKIQEMVERVPLLEEVKAEVDAICAKYGDERIRYKRLWLQMTLRTLYGLTYRIPTYDANYGLTVSEYYSRLSSRMSLVNWYYMYSQRVYDQCMMLGDSIWMMSKKRFKCMLELLLSVDAETYIQLDLTKYSDVHLKFFLEYGFEDLQDPNLTFEELLIRTTKKTLNIDLSELRGKYDNLQLATICAYLQKTKPSSREELVYLPPNTDFIAMYNFYNELLGKSGPLRPRTSVPLYFLSDMEMKTYLDGINANNTAVKRDKRVGAK